LLTGIISPGEENSVGIVASFHRPPKAPFSETDAFRLKLLLPHLSRSLGTMLKLRDAEFRVVNCQAALDNLTNGIVLFSQNGGVIFSNRVANNIFEQNDGLTLTKHHLAQCFPSLKTQTPRSQVELNTAIAQTVKLDILSTPFFSCAVAIERISGKPFYILNISQLPPDNRFGNAEHTPCGIIFIKDSSAPVKLNTELLAITYGLSKAECRFVASLVDGETLENSARKLNLSINTLKTHLKNIYKKTGTGNRAELLKLLITLAIPES
jgi:DNA-binding CsgD family transcriptional regulator